MIMNTRDDVPVLFLGIPTLIKATAETTNGAFGLIEHLSMPPGFASPYHRHHLEDEAFYVLEGEVAFVCDGKWMNAGAGAYVFGPREIPHGFKVVGSAPAKMLVLCAPAGFERFILELSEPSDPSKPPSAPDIRKLMAVAAQYKIDILGPLPDQPATSDNTGSTDSASID
jgi:quercetin dioxygenase-like cupin family protein